MGLFVRRRSAMAAQICEKPIWRTAVIHMKNSVYIFASLAFFVLNARADGGYQRLEDRRQFVESATSDTVKDLYKTLLYDLKKRDSNLSEENISDELQKIESLSARDLKHLAALLTEKQASYYHTQEFANEAKVKLSASTGVLKRSWSKIKAMLSKGDQILLRNGCSCDAKECCIGTTVCAASSCCCGAVGGAMGGFIGASSGYLVYTVVFLIASGIAGPLDGWYSWTQILIAVGSGGACGSSIGYVIGAICGGCMGCSWIYENHKNPFAEFAFLDSVLDMKPIAEDV